MNQDVQGCGREISAFPGGDWGCVGYHKEPGGLFFSGCFESKVELGGFSQVVLIACCKFFSDALGQTPERKIYHKFCNEKKKESFFFFF